MWVEPSVRASSKRSLCLLVLSDNIAWANVLGRLLPAPDACDSTYLIEINSTSKTSVEPAGMGPCAWLP